MLSIAKDAVLNYFMKDGVLPLAFLVMLWLCGQKSAGFGGLWQ